MIKQEIERISGLHNHMKTRFSKDGPAINEKKTLNPCSSFAGAKSSRKGLVEQTWNKNSVNMQPHAFTICWRQGLNTKLPKLWRLFFSHFASLIFGENQIRNEDCFIFFWWLLTFPSIYFIFISWIFWWQYFHFLRWKVLEQLHSQKTLIFWARI